MNYKSEGKHTIQELENMCKELTEIVERYKHEVLILRARLHARNLTIDKVNAMKNCAEAHAERLINILKKQAY